MTALQTNSMTQSSSPAQRPAGDLDSLAEQIKKCLANINDMARTCLTSAFHAGGLLNKAKANMDHGEWSQWLKDNCQLTERTAQRYMRLADNRQMLEAEMKSKSATVADFTLRQAERLITARPGSKPGSKSAPEDAKAIGGNDPAVAVAALEDKYLDALQTLKRNDHDKAREVVRAILKRLRDADLLDN